jgi:hypothetical protein
VDARRERRDKPSVRGGIKAAAEIQAAAALCALGLDGMRLLEATDEAESLVLQVVAEESVAVLKERDKALASEIANAVSKLFR